MNYKEGLNKVDQWFVHFIFWFKYFWNLKKKKKNYLQLLEFTDLNYWKFWKLLYFLPKFTIFTDSYYKILLRITEFFTENYCIFTGFYPTENFCYWTNLFPYLPKISVTEFSEIILPTHPLLWSNFLCVCICVMSQILYPGKIWKPS